VRVGDKVTHQEYGSGVVRELLGAQASVEFIGERLIVPVVELTRDAPSDPVAPVSTGGLDRILFRRAFEAVNLGVVPPHPDQLLALSVGGKELGATVKDWLDQAPEQGLCKAVFGDYGFGKSHYLRVIEAFALRAGWAVSFVEFDPKQADPAKPHLVYGAVMSALRFPKRQDGTQARGLFDFVGEIRQHWDRVADGPQFLESPWFEPALAIIRKHSHDEDQDYLDAVGWLFGQVQLQGAIQGLARRVGVKAPRSMPRTLESSDIYVHHLVVVNEMCRRLGYKGLLVLLDEAEHVRGFTVRRRERAANLFDVLAQSAHRPSSDIPAPARNEHGIRLPQYWKTGPHFGLVVALTEGETFSGEAESLREACVFLHEERDLVRLSAPSSADYRGWCLAFLERFSEHYPAEAGLLGGSSGRSLVARVLAEEYELADDGAQTLRLWTKLASFVPAMLLANAASSLDGLIHEVRRVARAASGKVLPWEA
jgi:hypothetical protein